MAWQDILCLAMGGFFAIRWKQLGAEMHRAHGASESTPVRRYQVVVLALGVTILALVVLTRVPTW